MKGTVIIFVLAVELVLDAMPTMAATKVFLLGGQSNMAGVGGYPGEPGYPADEPSPPPYNQVQSAVKFWNYGSNHTNGNGVNVPTTGDGWIDLQPGYGYTSQEFGPELSFGYRLHELYPNDEIYLVKLGISGTNLAVNWNPNGTGSSYNLFRSRVNAALDNLTGANKPATIAGMLWMQGEADAQNHTFALAYQENLTSFIAKVRSDFASPDMTFVLGRILTSFGTPSDNALVRDAQGRIPNQVNNAAFFSTDDLQLAYIGHYGTQGQIDLGIRFANQFVQVPEPSAWIIILSAVLVIFTAYVLRKRYRTFECRR